ncbi:putative ABC transporter permease [Enorma massiliensis]|uniref:putative ABC transporter permease n=1 Tax=Enorma massiliensis TaxID=1472761 RepID=UPI0019576514|nr:putative ABC transporter permease [Enorma massiliensis]MBM6892222.1 putative ABC transporter permease [Enorma massiliensis]
MLFTITVFIVALFLVARGITFLIQRYLDFHGAGRSFKKLLRQGRIDAGVYADAVWSEVNRFGHKKLRAKISKEQQRVIRDARRQLRDDFLNDNRPGFYQYLIIFLVASVLGLILETIWMFVAYGVLESRVGLVWGPFSPLYGCGAVLLTVVLWRLRDQPTWMIFLISAGLGGILEQLAGWSMETVMHAWSWSYLHFPDHITQWVAWRFLIVWGLLGVAWCKVIMPELLYRIGEPTSRRQAVVVSFLTAFIALDIAMTVACFWRAGKREEGVPPQNVFEEYVDRHFGDEFIKGKFENLRMDSDERPRTS